MSRDLPCLGISGKSDKDWFLWMATGLPIGGSSWEKFGASLVSQDGDPNKASLSLNETVSSGGSSFFRVAIRCRIFSAPEGKSSRCGLSKSSGVGGPLALSVAERSRSFLDALLYSGLFAPASPPISSHVRYSWGNRGAWECTLISGKPGLMRLPL